MYVHVCSFSLSLISPFGIHTQVFSFNTTSVTKALFVHICLNLTHSPFTARLMDFVHQIFNDRGAIHMFY